MPHFLRHIATATWLGVVTLGGLPLAHAAPQSEWLGASGSHYVVTLAVPVNGGVGLETASLPLQTLLPGQALGLVETRSNLLGTPVVLSQVDWNLSTALQVTHGTVGFDRVTLDIDMAMSHLLLPGVIGQAPPLGYLTLSGMSRVEAPFRLDAVTDLRMFGSSGLQEVAQAFLFAEISIWDDAQAEWQALADRVPAIELGQSFEWATQLGPGLYLWTPVMKVDHVVKEGSSLAFNTGFYLTLELSELAVPPPPVPEPGSLALAAVGLAVLCWRRV